MGDGGASNTSPCIAEIRARSPIFNGCLPSASGDVRDRSNPRTGLACVDPKACPCMSTRRATSAGVSACRLRAQEADIGVWHGPIDSPDTTRRELQMDVLAKKVAIVTGASSGIGRATARLFAREGARVVVSGRRSAELDALVSDIEAEGGQAIAVPGDIKHEQVAKALVDTAVDPARRCRCPCRSWRSWRANRPRSSPPRR